MAKYRVIFFYSGQNTNNTNAHTDTHTHTHTHTHTSLELRFDCCNGSVGGFKKNVLLLPSDIKNVSAKLQINFNI
jgi:hypothetical protein